MNLNSDSQSTDSSRDEFLAGWHLHRFNLKEKYPDDENPSDGQNSLDQWPIVYHGVYSPALTDKSQQSILSSLSDYDSMKSQDIGRREALVNRSAIFVAKSFQDVMQKCSKSFTISKENNRMAYQLEETLENDLKPIITSLVMPGTVQLTPSGKLIALMRDCQTTGGYPRVLQFSEKSICILSQKSTGNKVKFRLTE